METKNNESPISLLLIINLEIWADSISVIFTKLAWLDCKVFYIQPVYTD
jgi:hypothetical protein